MPYLLLIVARREGIEIHSAVVGLVALFAAIGFCLKPYFLIAPLILELYLLVTLGWRKAMFRREQFAMVIVGIAYIFAIFLFTPDYLSRVVKFGLEVYQLGYGQGYVIALLRASTVIFISLMAYFWLRVRPNQNADTSI